MTPINSVLVPDLGFHGVGPIHQSASLSGFPSTLTNTFSPNLVDDQHDQLGTGGHPNMEIHDRCQCGPNCNCLRCKSHPTNPATTQWMQEVSDILNEDIDNESVPTNRPQSSFSQPAPAAFEFGQDWEAQEQGVDPEPGLPMPIDWNDYSLFTFPISECSKNVNCRCGDDCRCEGCLTHSGHVKL